MPRTDEEYRTRSQVVYLVSGYRIHQVRVKGEKCGIAGDMAHLKDATCYPAFTGGADNEQRGAFIATDNETVWEYEDESAVKGHDMPITGSFGTYPVGGYTVSINATTAEEGAAAFRRLWQLGWVDPATRAVVIDFTVFNPSQELVTVVKALAEFTAMGRILPSYSIKTFRYKPLLALDKQDWWIDCLLMLMVVVYAGAEVIDIALFAHKEAKEQAARLAVRAMQWYRSSVVLSDPAAAAACPSAS